MKPNEESVIAATVAWLELIVIDLNLCPFAKAVHVKDQILYSVSDEIDTAGMLAALKQELNRLVETSPAIVDSTLLIFSKTLGDFTDYRHFLDLSTLVLEELKLDGIIQIASFHPKYVFAGTAADDVTNFTNRSPYPMLHLLREESVTRAVESLHGSEGIYERNIATMNTTGTAKMEALMNQAKQRDRCEKPLTRSQDQ